MRMTFSRARDVLGLPHEFQPTQHDSYDLMLAKWKEEVVEARRQENAARETELNEVKAFVKKRKKARESKVCPTCGDYKTSHGDQCKVCSNRRRYYNDTIMEKSNVKMYAIEDGVMVPGPRGESELTVALKKLERLGQSFCTPAKHCTITLKAKEIGVKIIARLVDKKERDPDKKVYRVWRSDGLRQSQLNEYISGNITLEQAMELAKQNQDL